MEATVNGITLTLTAERGLFSPEQVDRGTRALLSCVLLAPGDKVLDLGCGYGVVGIYAAKIAGPDSVFMIDNDPGAVACARQNAVRNNVSGVHILLSDGFSMLKETEFSRILCNPPYHVDFSVPKAFIEKGFNRLKIGGQMWMVTKREAWYRNKFQAIFGGVTVHQRDDYFVFEACKTSASYASRSR